MNPCCDTGRFACTLEGVGRVRPGEEEAVARMVGAKKVERRPTGLAADGIGY